MCDPEDSVAQRIAGWIDMLAGEGEEQQRSGGGAFNVLTSQGSRSDVIILVALHGNAGLGVKFCCKTGLFS